MIFAFAAAGMQSIMLIASDVKGGQKSGTGFVVSSTANATDILTANHVIQDALAVYIYPVGPNGQRYEATVLRSDPLRDVALLEINLGNLPALPLADIASPTSGTKVEVSGYPALGLPPPPNASGTKPAPNASPTPAPTPAPLHLQDMRLRTVDGFVDGASENGESVLIDAPVTHGDSGAPVLEVGTGRVVGMVLGLAGGYIATPWMNQDGLGDSVASLTSILSPPPATPLPKAPAFIVETNSDADPTIVSSWDQLFKSANISPLATAKATTCDDGAGAAQANALFNQYGTPTDMSIEVDDCSGATIFHNELFSQNMDELNLIRLLDRTFAGFIDTHRAKWNSLLRVGVFADPTLNPYLALMSVERNPFGQLVIGHTFRGGPADRAGIKPGDAVVKIDGSPTRSLGDHYIARLLNQPDVTLLLSRQLKEFNVHLKLQRYLKIVAAGPVPR